MRVLIVEDEVAASQRLVKLLMRVAPDAQVLESTDSISSTVEWLKANPRPDLIFMDIHLADGASFDIFDQVKVTSPVIFTTAYDQYAIQAFKVNSIDYLLKPIKEDELRFAVDKFRQLSSGGLDIESVLRTLKEQQGPEFKQRFLVSYADKLKAIDTNDVAYFLAHEKSVFIVTTDGRRYATNQTIERIESTLDPNVFFRINRKLIVSIGSIAGMFSYSKSRVKLTLKPDPEIETIVSTDRASAFKEWLDN